MLVGMDVLFDFFFFCSQHEGRKKIKENKKKLSLIIRVGFFFLSLWKLKPDFVSLEISQRVRNKFARKSLKTGVGGGI